MHNRKIFVFFGLIVGLLFLLILRWPYFFPNQEMLNSKSSYLNQHKNDYVEWRSWGQDALLQAKKENKLLFISVGFATCYWCHYMQEDSFQNFFLARFLNNNFIPILIDKEVDVEINRIYMQSMVFQNGLSGWPMTIIATPDGVPIFLNITMHRKELLKTLNYYYDLWLEKPDQIMTKASLWLKSYSDYYKEKKNNQITDHLADLQLWLSDNIDPIMGALKGAPKFPNAYRWLTLTSLDENYMIHMKTMVDQILRSPIYDIVDGGVHRYSSDKIWTVPHYEKLLIDQVYFLQMLISLYSKYKQDYYLFFADMTIEFIFNFLKNSDGFFITGLDAGNVNYEGHYYFFENNVFNQASSGLNFINLEASKGLVSLKSLNDFKMFNRSFYQKYRKNNRLVPKKDHYVNLAVNAQLMIALVQYQLTTKSNRFISVVDLLKNTLTSFKGGSFHDQLAIFDALSIIGIDGNESYINELKAQLILKFPYFKSINFLPDELVIESFEDDYNGPQALYYILKYKDLFQIHDDLEEICNNLNQIIVDPWDQISLVKIYNKTCY